MCASPCVPGAHGDQRLDPMDLELEMAVSHEVGCIAWWYHHQGALVCGSPAASAFRPSFQESILSAHSSCLNVLGIYKRPHPGIVKTS